MLKKSAKRLYLIPVLSKALDVLEILQQENRPMSLESIFLRVHFPKTTIYRILKTFVHRGYLVQLEDGQYRAIGNPRKMVFGFASQSSDMPFSEAVTRSLVAAAAEVGVDLKVLDNRHDAAIAVKNAEEFVRSRVDLVIEFQVDQQVAAIVGDRIAGAGIPLIAVDIPHPHAVYFGIDNFRVGFEAGRLLADHAERAWAGKVNWVLGLDLAEAGPLVQSRITGVFEAVRSQLPEIPIESFVRMNSRGTCENSFRLVLDFLSRHPRDRNILIAAATDTSALGAVQAVRESKREQQIAVVGQYCGDDVVEEMAAPRTPLIGTVSHEADTYGTRLIQLGLAMLGGERVPPYNYVEHKVVERKPPHLRPSA